VSLMLILDGLIVILLIATIAYAVVLNQKLNLLRKNKDDLSRMIANFNEATVRAESSIPRLRKAADEARQALQEKVEKAQQLRDDLAFMIERGDSMANRLESSVRMARGEARPATPARPTAGPFASTSSAATSPSAGPTTGARPAARPGSLFATPPGEDEFGNDDSSSRSEAERELLRALQSAR
jgi:hypothetical protein